MWYGVFIIDPKTGLHYMRTVWFDTVERANIAKDDWLTACPDCQAVVVSNINLET